MPSIATCNSRGQNGTSLSLSCTGIVFAWGPGARTAPDFREAPGSLALHHVCANTTGLHLGLGCKNTHPHHTTHPGYFLPALSSQARGLLRRDQSRKATIRIEATASPWMLRHARA